MPTLPAFVLAKMPAPVLEKLPPVVLPPPVNPDDTIHTGDLIGPQVFDGGDGTDKLVIDDLHDPTNGGFGFATVDLNAGFIAGSQLDGSTLLSIENVEVNTSMFLQVSGSAGDNEITVNFSSPFKDTGYNSVDIFAGDGNDTIEITKGWSASVFGGEGNDTIHITDATNAQAIGGNGDDTIEFTNIGGSGAGSVFVSGRAGNDTIVLTNVTTSFIEAGTGDDYVEVSGITGETGIMDIADSYSVEEGPAGNDTYVLGEGTQRLFFNNTGIGHDQVSNFGDEDYLLFSTEGGAGITKEETVTETIFTIDFGPEFEQSTVTVDAIGLIQGQDWLIV